MDIVILVKEVSDTWGARRIDPATGVQDRSQSDQIIDEIVASGLEKALELKKQHGGTVTALLMGAEATSDSLRKCFAMGADAAVHVSDPQLAGSDAMGTARALASALRTIPHDLVIAGNQSTDGRMGVIPSMLAELLGVPQLTNLRTLEVSGPTVSGQRATETGYTVLEAELPAVVSVTEQIAEPRFPTLRGTLAARKKKADGRSAAHLGLTATSDARAMTIVDVAERPARSGGTVVRDEGDGKAADQLVAFLADRRLL